MLRWPEIAILVGFALVAGIFAARVPVFEAPDEPFHLDYVNFLLERHELPNQLEESKRVFREGHQPPLYYLLAAALVAPIRAGEPVRVALERNPEHVQGGGVRPDVAYFAHPSAAPFAAVSDRIAFWGLRLLGIALGVVNLALVLRIARRFLPAASAWLAAVLMAALPQFLFVSGSINNDNLANLVATAVILATLRVLERPESVRDAVVLGLLLGVGLCVKKTSLALLPPIVVLFAWRLATGETPRIRVLANAVAALAAMLAVGGWVLVRNQMLYGDPLGSAMERRTLHFIVSDQSVFAPYFRGLFWSATAQSFVGMFGWMQVRLPWVVYAGWWLLLAGGIAAAWIFGFVARAGRAPVALATGFALACLAAAVYYNTTFPEPQGRFLFPALAALMATAAGGLHRLGARLGRAAAPLCGALLAALGLVDAVAWLRIDAFY